jgi:hypothetical protein
VGQKRLFLAYSFLGTGFHHKFGRKKSGHANFFNISMFRGLPRGGQSGTIGDGVSGLPWEAYLWPMNNGAFFPLGTPAHRFNGPFTNKRSNNRGSE